MIQASVNQVYQGVKRLAAKQEQGFISPEDFNIYAQNAQQQLFQLILEEYRSMLAGRSRYLTYWKNHYNSIDEIKDDLRHLEKYEVTLTYVSGGPYFSLPDDYAYLISARYGNTDIEIEDIARKSYHVNSYDAAPTTTHPIGFLKGTTMQVLPTSIESGVTLNYYKTPQGITTAGVATTTQPTWGYTTTNGLSIYNSSTSVDFEFPKHLEPRLIMLIAGYAGVEIREELLMQFAEQQKILQIQNENGG